MKAAIGLTHLVRGVVVLALTAVASLVVAGAALAGVTAPGRGMPGQATGGPASGSWLEIGAVLIMLAVVALGVAYEGARSHQAR